MTIDVCSLCILLHHLLYLRNRGWSWFYNLNFHSINNDHLKQQSPLLCHCCYWRWLFKILISPFFQVLYHPITTLKYIKGSMTQQLCINQYTWLTFLGNISRAISRFMKFMDAATRGSFKKVRRGERKQWWPLEAKKAVCKLLGHHFSRSFGSLGKIHAWQSVKNLLLLILKRTVAGFTPQSTVI